MFVCIVVFDDWMNSGSPLALLLLRKSELHSSVSASIFSFHQIQRTFIKMENKSNQHQNKCRQLERMQNVNVRSGPCC